MIFQKIHHLPALMSKPVSKKTRLASRINSSNVECFWRVRVSQREQKERERERKLYLRENKSILVDRISVFIIAMIQLLLLCLHS